MAPSCKSKCAARPIGIFIGPKAGGLEIVHDKQEITVITPQSPLGEQLFEKKQGDKFRFGSGRDATDGKIIIVR
jgi:hypothetical protein